MRLLLDTHLIIWWEAGSPKLPAELPEMVHAADATFVSQASLWEVAIKQSLGKLQLDINAFATNVGAHGFEWLDIANQHLIEVARLPFFKDHKDPFDRLLVAQSMREPLHLITVDGRLGRYGDTVTVL